MSHCFGSGSTQSQTGKQEHKLSKTEGTTPGSLNMSHGQTDLSVKPDNVKIKGLQANVSLCSEKNLVGFLGPMPVQDYSDIQYIS